MTDEAIPRLTPEEWKALHEHVKSNAYTGARILCRAIERLAFLEGGAHYARPVVATLEEVRSAPGAGLAFSDPASHPASLRWICRRLDAMDGSIRRVSERLEALEPKPVEDVPDCSDEEDLPPSFRAPPPEDEVEVPPLVPPPPREEDGLEEVARAKPDPNEVRGVSSIARRSSLF